MASRATRGLSRSATARLGLLALAVTALVGCGGGQDGASPTPPGSPSPGAPAPAPPASQPPSPPGPPVPVTKVLTIVLENHGPARTRAGMPRLMALAGTYGQTSAYRALTHPSLPNYVAMAGGTLPPWRDDSSPAGHPLAGASVFDTALAHGHTARTYAEAMPANCALTDDGRYAVRHNPWAYFSDAAARAACARDDVPAGTLTAGALHDDITHGRLPHVGLVVPDACNDAHDCPLAIADDWVAGWVAQLQAGPDWRSGHLAIVVTFDEAELVGDNQVLTVVVAPGVRGVVVPAPLSHLSWTAWMSQLVGAPAPGESAGAPSLGTAFGL